MVTHLVVRPQRNKTHRFSYSSNSGTGIPFRMGVRWLLSGGPPQTALTPESKKKKLHREKKVSLTSWCATLFHGVLFMNSRPRDREKKNGWLLPGVRARLPVRQISMCFHRASLPVMEIAIF